MITDPVDRIAPTPRFEFNVHGINTDAEKEFKESLYSSYVNKNVGVTTRTIGHPHLYKSHFDVDELENEIADFEESSYAASVKRPRQIDPEDLQAIESEANEVIVDPSKPRESLPTFTVGTNGILNIPTPSIEKVEPYVEKKSAERQHRFLPQKETAKPTLDTVTYVGFVDFTTTIDDTVVIFKPKNTYNTKPSDSFREPKIMPTSAFTRAFQQTRTRPSIAPSSVINLIEKENEVEDSFSTDDDEDVNPLSGLDKLKSLYAQSARQRSSALNTRSRFSPSPSSNIASTPTLKPEIQEQSELVGSEAPVEIISSIGSDVELVFKTLYTTYTFFTTYFRENTTRVNSREEVISNAVTLTNILKSTDLPAISSSCELDSSCQFTSTNTLDLKDFSGGFIGRPNTRPVEESESVRSNAGQKIAGLDLEIDADSVLKTFYTTYTLLSTVFKDGTSSVATITDVYSNVQTNGVPVISSSEAIKPTSKLSFRTPSASVVPSKSNLSVFPIRRLEVSSVLNRQLNSDLTTPESDTTTLEDEVTTIDSETTTAKVTTYEDNVEYVTSETPALTEEATEFSVTEATESSEEISADEVGIVPRTQYTTFTYFTTKFTDGNSSLVTTSEKTVTNIITDENFKPTEVEPSVTIFTTFTYFTTMYEENNKTIVKSNEETLTNFLPATASSDINVQHGAISSNIPIIDASKPTKIEQTVFSLPNPSVEDVESSSSSVFTPSLQSSEDEEDRSTQDTFSTATSPISSSISFEEIDDDLTLTTENDDTTTEPSTEESTRRIVRPSRARGRGSSSRPGTTFTPNIRPILRKPPRLFRPTNQKVSTTVATRTRNSVKPTLIATPASSALNTPQFSSSRFLASASLLNRGQSRFSSSAVRSSGNPSINPSAVLDRGTVSFSATVTPTPGPVPVTSSPFRSRVRGENPFRARLRELKEQRLRKLSNAGRSSPEPNTTDEPNVDSVSLPIPNFPSIPGGNTPIFVSSQRQRVSKAPAIPTQDIEVPDDIALRRQRARDRIRKLFSSRRESLRQSRRKRQIGQMLEISSRQKRQVPFGAEFGSRTREKQSYSLRRSSSYQPQYFLDRYQDIPPPFTAFQTQQKDNNNLYNNNYDNNNDLFSSSSGSSTDSSRVSKNFRRQVPEPVTSSRSRSRSRSRFRGSSSSSSAQTTTSRPISRPRTRFRDSRFRTTAPTTTTENPRFNNRFPPRTFGSSRAIENNRNTNRFSDTRTRESLFSTTSRNRNTNTAQRNSLFDRPKVVDYSDYDYYDYEDTNIQSSDDSVPDFITVTHLVPVATRIPVVEFGRTEFRDILSSSPSLEVVAVTALKSTEISNSPVIYANAQTITPQAGVQEILFDALRATETTRVTFTPTRIRGRRTSFSKIIPSTIYNVETITTQTSQSIDQNQLLNSLIQHLLLGQTPTNPNRPALPVQPVVTPTPATQFVTHTSTYVTTITEESSTELPITFRGREVTTTIVDSSTKVVTATEFSTETIINNNQPLLLPTQALPQFAQIQPTQPPAINQQIASLLPALLGSPLLSQQQQQQQEQALQQKVLQEALLAQQAAQQAAQQLKKQQEELLLQQQQEALNEQLLAEINLDDFTDEDLANLDIDAVLDAVANKNPGLIFPNKNLFDDVIAPTAAAAPRSSLVTIFKSGDNPGEFTSLVSTVFLDANRRIRKREALNPSKPIPIQATQIQKIDSLWGPRGPVEVQLSDIDIESSITVSEEVSLTSSELEMFTETP